MCHWRWVQSLPVPVRFSNQAPSRAAIEMFEHAIESDPSFAVAHAWLACGLGQAMAYQPDEYDALLNGAQAAAERGLELDPSDSECLRILAKTKATAGSCSMPCLPP